MGEFVTSVLFVPLKQVYIMLQNEQKIYRYSNNLAAQLSWSSFPGIFSNLDICAFTTVQIHPKLSNYYVEHRTFESAGSTGQLDMKGYDSRDL